MNLSLIPRTFWDDSDDLFSFSSSPSSGISVSEDNDKVYVSAALPGVDEKDIEITFDKGTLWVKGVVEEKEEDKKRKYYRQSSSNFSYQIAVPGDLDQNAEPEAMYKNGVMTVTFKKSPQSQPKKIAIKKAN